MMNEKHFLFSYGTLQLAKVQLENYGRILLGKKDKLCGYKLEKLEITDPSVIMKSNLKFHPIAVKSESKNDFIEGTIFELTEEELKETDKYEVSEYHRVLETFTLGKKAWVYVAKNNRKI
jgi:gamma-glutamylcyclotransferase (GGCT)/AIG2-like uncharacterized protein YtfP